MSMLLWRILCLISAVFFIAGIIVLLVVNPTKNKYYRNYHEDELFKKERTVNSVNSIYLTSGDTKKFIKKYVVCKSAYEKYFVCNFVRPFSEIKYYVVQFSRRKRVISVLEVWQRDLTTTSSKIIALKKSCARVNVVIASAEGTQLNNNYIRPMSMTRLRLYAFLKSFVIFTALFVLRHVIIEVVGGSYIYGRDVALLYLNNSVNYIAVAASFVLSALSYLVTVLCYRSKSNSALNGGALEYEFV